MSARRWGIAVLVAASIALSGCAATTTGDLDAATAQALQASVVDVATLAADGDVTAALVRLDALQVELDAAVESESLSDERAEAIQSAIDAVRADLEALVAVPDPSPTPTDDEDDENDDDDDKPGKGNKPEKPGKP